MRNFRDEPEEDEGEDTPIIIDGDRETVPPRE